MRKKEVEETLLQGFFNILMFPVALVLFFFLIVNLTGLLLGYENPSPFCNALDSKNQTNLEYYFTPVGPYACKENAGLLQPAVKDLFNWLGDTHK
jgi:hypothetical protein